MRQLGWTALMEASFRGFHDVLALLLHKGANLDIKNNVSVYTCVRVSFIMDVL
jgi:ankyrin repeat protein